MKTSYINNLMSSFYLWLDHEILNKGEAFINYTGQLYKNYDPNFHNFSIYSSPFRQWVYDESIIGANIPSGVYINNNFISKGVSGLSIDYNKGRAIFNKNVNINSNIYTNYALKEFNIYYTDEREESLLFEKSYSVRPKTHQITGGLNYLDIPYPCIFIKNKSTENIPFALGGEDLTFSTIRCVVLTNNSFSLDSIISVLNDSARKVFPVLHENDFPFNYFGDFKTGNSFNYINLCKSQPKSNMVLIEKVVVSKLDEVQNSDINKKVVAGIIDFEISSVRNPRS